MVRRIIIFDQSIDGHHLEYINHIYWQASEMSDCKFFFILHPNFRIKKELLEWPICDNIYIDYLSDEELIKINRNSILSAISLSKALKQRVRTFEVTEVLLLNLISFLPAIIFFFNSKVKISGIIYLIYLYRWKKSGIRKKLEDVFKYIILSKANIFKKVFLLNDDVSPRYLNAKYKTKVFTYLPDPINSMYDKKAMQPNTVTRTSLSINQDKTVYLHFGALNDRKGTLEILKALTSGKINDLENLYFIFAGKVGDDIKEDFYRYIDAKPTFSNILIFDKFCDYNFIYDLCILSDCILMPYKVNEQSSGLLNYASIFGKPVLGIDEGLLGRIIKKYKMGYLIKNCDSKFLIDFFNVKNDMKLSDNNLYISNNSIENFKRKIF